MSWTLASATRSGSSRKSSRRRLSRMAGRFAMEPFAGSASDLVVVRRPPKQTEALQSALEMLERALADRDALRDALRSLVAAFPDLDRQFTGTEQQRALRAAHAVLAEQG